eukprot:919334-Amphidinium_carterae.1
MKLTTKNLMGTLALDPKREVAWTIMRKLIKITPSSMEKEKEDNPDQILDATYLQSKISYFDLQTKTSNNEPEYGPIHDIIFATSPCG